MDPIFSMLYSQDLNISRNPPKQGPLQSLERNDDGHCFWARAYFAPLSKLDLDEVRQLMADRDRED